MNTVISAEEYFESKKRTFRGEGDFIDKEDFLSYASQFQDTDKGNEPTDKDRECYVLVDPKKESPIHAMNYYCILEDDDGDEYCQNLLFNGETWHDWEDETAEYEEPCENIKYWLKKSYL
jgi:hypothetical protein